MILGG